MLEILTCVKKKYGTRKLYEQITSLALLDLLIAPLEMITHWTIVKRTSIMVELVLSGDYFLIISATFSL